MNAPIASILLSLSCLQAQGPLAVHPCGGGLGAPLSFAITGGKASAQVAFITGARRATVPLTWLDPGETRTLGVGLDFPGLLFFLPLDGKGELRFGTTFPNDPGLAGLATLHQVASFPGTGRVLDDISGVAVVPLEFPGIWRQPPNKMTVPRLSATGIDLGDGRYMIVGGGTGTILWQKATDTTDVFDSAKRSFAAGPAMTAKRAAHTQTRLGDGRYLIAGGVDDNNVPQASCEVFDPKTMKFTAVKPMATKRTLHTAALLPDGRVLVACGTPVMTDASSAIFGSLNTTEIYDPGKDTWVAGPTLGSFRMGHGMVDLGSGRYLIAGGLSWTTIFGNKVPSTLRTCEILTATSTSVTAATTGSLRTARSLMGMFVLPDGTAMSAGGMTGRFNIFTQFFETAASNVCEVYNPTTRSWTGAQAMPVKAAGAAVVAQRDGRFAVVGGGSNTIYWPHANQESQVYDPAKKTWSALPKLNTGRMAAVAFELQACGLAAFGGGTGNSAAAVDTWEMVVR